MGFGCCGVLQVFFPSVAYSRKPHRSDHHESSTYVVTVAGSRTFTEREKINPYASWKLNPSELILKHWSKKLLVPLGKYCVCAFRVETHLETPASEDCNCLLCDMRWKMNITVFFWKLKCYLLVSTEDLELCPLAGEHIWCCSGKIIAAILCTLAFTCAHASQTAKPLSPVAIVDVFATYLLSKHTSC